MINKTLDLKRNDFLAFFIHRHKRNYSLYTFPIFFVMIIIATVARIMTSGFDIIASCYVIILIVGLVYILSIPKLCKSYENNPFNLEIDKGIYKISRRNETGKFATTFKQELEKFLYYDENEKYYFLFVAKNNTFILPKEAFNEEEIQYLNGQISKKVTKRKNPLFIKILNIVLAISAVVFSVIFIVGLCK